LYSNVGGNLNTANGHSSLYSNTTGYQNTAVGGQSLYSNTTGYRNTALGMYALNANLLGANNTATGSFALYTNNMGNNNTGHGYRALNANTTGSYNTAQGSYALDDNFGGNYNTAVGYNSGPAVDLLSNTTAIGYLAAPTASNQVRIGNTSVTSIGGQVAWTVFSDGRFKKDIKEDVSGLDFIKKLRPVSYTVDKVGLNKFLHVNDSSSNPSEVKSIPVRQTGFVAQEVEALVKKSGYVFSGVDAPENENDPYGIRYDEFVVPLVKGMQELTARLEEQEQKIAEQEQKIDSLVNQLASKSEIEKGMGIDDRAVLFQNNPNPFDAETEIKMTVPENVGFATVMIYNLEGKQMKNIQVDDRGQVSVKISGSELSAGMYLYALIADGKVVDTKRMILTQ
jgi:trimeric autotransporter adhesin